MRKFKLTVSEAVTFYAEAVAMLAELGIAADVLAVDQVPDVNALAAGVSGLAARPPAFQWKTSFSLSPAQPGRPAMALR